MSLSRILRRTAVSPKMARMSSRPMPRTSSRFCRRSGHLPSMVVWLMRNRSTASSATRPCPREISSSPSSLLPRPDSPVIITPRPRMSMNTPCMVSRSAKCLDRYARSTSITKADDSRVANMGICARSHMDSSASDATCPSASTSTGGSSVTMRAMRRIASSGVALLR